jgi:hypothetical protein
VFSILIPFVIDVRQSRKWQHARQNFGQEVLLLHVAFGEGLLRFARTPEGAPLMPSTTPIARSPR